jgi:ligand-binding sensor domain-containing protein
MFPKLQVLSILCYVFSFALIVSTPSFAQQYAVELLDENDGFETSIVFSIVQDQQGFLWFGTAYDGLMRFDGKNVVSYRRDGSPRFELKHNEYGNLLTDRLGRIWMGGWGSSLAVLDPITNDVQYFKHNPNDQSTISGPYVQEVFEDARGNMWFGSRSNGLSRFLADSEQFERFSFNQPISDSPGSGTSHRRIWAINQTHENALWIGTEFGLNRLDIDTQSFDYMLPDKDIGPIGINKIRHITPMSSQELLLGTQEGALVYDIESGSFEPVDTEFGIQLGPIFSVLKTYFGQYWLTTRRGIYSFTDQDRTLRKVPLGIDDSCALTLFQDKQNIIWMSCEGKGIYKIVPQTFFKTLDHPIASSAYSLTRSNDGNILIGTEADGIYKWQLDTNNVSLHANIDSKPQLSVNRIAEDRGGDIWFSDNQSLYKFNGIERYTKVIPPQGTPFPERFRGFVHILEASDGLLWIGTGNGVFVIEDLNKPFKYYEHNAAIQNSLTSSKLAEIYEDRQGRIWLGTENGVNLWQPETNDFRRFYTPNADQSSDHDIAVYAIYQDINGQVWAGSSAGLHLVNEDKLTLETKGKRDFRGSVGVRIIKGDNAGNIWMVTQVGVLKYNPSTDEIREFDESDGLSGARYFINLATQSDDGTIFISSRDGIHYFNPSQIQDHQLNSQTVLTNFEVLGDSGEPYTSFKFENGIALAPDENYIRFDFSTLDLDR